MKKFAMVIHGGAGQPNSKDEGTVAEYESILDQVLDAGQRILEQGGSALDAVERAVMCFEDAPRFNAGRGGALNVRGEHELDASIMDGNTLRCGAVAAARHIKNPVQAARRVLHNSRHVMYVAEGADAFADAQGLQMVEPSYFMTPYLAERWDKYVATGGEDPSLETGTVGAAALDAEGNIAAATSTGGTMFKEMGRVGDSPIVGAGTYAKNGLCGVSCTGIGEEFVRHAASHRVAALMEMRSMSLQDAIHQLVHETLPADSGGMIAVDAQGNIALEFNTPVMYRGAIDSEGLRLRKIAR